MRLATLALPALLAPGLALAQNPPSTSPIAPAGDRNFVAAIVGIASYQNIPDSAELAYARSDAATVARSLKDLARFDQVFTLSDTAATRMAIQDLLRNQVAQLLGPNDVFVLYFVGHGVGADLDLPVLLAADSTLNRKSVV